VTAVGPAATPAITSGKLGRDGWYTSAVTVSWYWVDSLTINTAKCPGSTSTPDQGAAVVISGTCTDTSGNVGHSSVTVKIDTTPPVVTVTGVANGAVYVVGHVPSAGCTTTDAVSGVAAPRFA